MDDLSHAIYGGHEGMHACCEKMLNNFPVYPYTAISMGHLPANHKIPFFSYYN